MYNEKEKRQLKQKVLILFRKHQESYQIFWQ